MNFKKYNFMLVFMLALVIAIPIVSLSAKTESSSADISSDLPIAEVDSTDQPTSSKPTMLDFKSSWQAYNYILNSTLNKSYIAETNQSLVATALGIEFSQKVKCKAYVTTDGKILEETYSSGKKKFFNTTFYDGENVYTKTVDGSFSVGNQPNVTPDKFGVEDYLATNGVLPAFVMKLNKKCFPNNSTPKRYDNQTGYYYIEANVTDSSLWQDYLKKVYQMSGSEKFPTMNSVNLKFIYSAKTGKVARIIMNESYNIKYMGFDVTCESTTVKDLSMVGGNVKLPNMSYMGM